jgi:D-alanyl-D-alanine dipeptidase
MQRGASAKGRLASYPLRCPIFVMPGFMPGIHVLASINRKKDVDGRNKSGHDDGGCRLVKAIVIALAAIAWITPTRAQTLPGGFVFLRDIDPTILQDIRYAGPNNFTGRPLPGYDAAECVVKRDVGLALKRVQSELALQKLSLKMLDCYRPARAVHDMVLWAQNGRETPAEHRYNPAFSKQDLFRLGYIAEHSGHSTGSAVDLTLVDLTASHSQAFDSRAFDPNKAYADCTASEVVRAPEGSVDMGTGYDCSDVKAHTAASSITPVQRRWRNLLVAVMAKQGFVNYAKEWWHFSLPRTGGPAYDFPITPRRN